MFLENTVCENWAKVLLETVCQNPTPSLIIVLRQIYEKNLNDQSFVNSYLNLIFDTMECLIRIYLEKTQDGECKDQHELCQTWKLVLNNLLDSHHDEIIKRCSLVITNYVKIVEVNIEDVENVVDQFVEDFLSCSQQDDTAIKLLYELFKCANNIDHSKAIKCCEIASYLDGSLLYTENNDNHIDTSSECFETVYALYSHMYVFTKLILKFFSECEQLPDQSNNVDKEFVNIMTNTICNVNVVANLLQYFSNVCLVKKKNCVLESLT